MVMIKDKLFIRWETQSPEVIIVLKLNETAYRPVSLFCEDLTLGHINPVPG